MRYVLCQGPGFDACSGELARALAEQGQDVQLTNGFRPVLQPDDWLHCAGAAALDEGSAREVLGLMACAPAAVSTHLVVDGHRCVDADLLWPALEDLLYTVGDIGGLLMIREQDLGWLCSDPAVDPAEAAHGWAEAYGLALCLVTRGTKAIAVKSDGRCTEASGARPVTDSSDLARFCAGFLRAFVDDPSDLDRALRMGLG
ncbi:MULTISPECIES: hypothetical protein [unclassified Luteococcus]|uniref:hypothetical protein n=1 Tax=unclassified Luteococcus TaxID=2639923 RepID=UPI00313B6C9F